MSVLTEQQIVANAHEGHVWVQGKTQPVTYSIDRLRPLPPKPKKIDMSKFAGSDVWLVHINNEEKRNQAKEFEKYPNILREAYRPMFDVWNHWTGDSEPEWLEGFEYEVMIAYPDGSQIGVDFETTSKPYKWSNVVAIKITGIKEGW